MNSMLRKISLLSIIALLLTPASTPADTITVDCNVEALIAAMDRANADAALDVIELAPGCVYTITEVRTTVTETVGGSTFDYGDVGLPPVNTPIIINGNIATIRRAEEAPDFRIFHILDTGNLTLNDLTITNGFADATRPDGTASAFPGSGGAIYNHRGHLEVNRSILRSNTAEYYGGAIFDLGAATTTYIRNSTIRDNSAPSGGGIFEDQTRLLSVEHSTIINNNAGNGGGINVLYGSELVVKDSVISFNHATGRGGGIYKDGGRSYAPTTITGSTFEGNSADLSGGGIFITLTPLKIADSRIVENQAGEYGGGLSYQDRGSETVEIRGTTFDGNTAVLGGGGIQFSGQWMTIEGSILQNNTAENGGGIFNAFLTEHEGIPRTDTTLIFNGGAIQDNTAYKDGGGIYNGGLLTVNGGFLSGNRSELLGGGIRNFGQITVQNSTFKSNNAGTDGGGLHTSGRTTVTGSTFLGNSATRGGGLASVNGRSSLTNNTFSANSAVDMGGGIFNTGPVIDDLKSPGSLDASFITVAYNNAPAGGGIATGGGLMNIKSSIVALNPANDCFSTGFDVFLGIGENLDSDDSCAGFTLKADPRLNPLWDNGGPTRTHALQMDSPAIDAAPDCISVWGIGVISVDQRGQLRPISALCDLGAYEYDQRVTKPTPTLQSSTPTSEPPK